MLTARVELTGQSGILIHADNIDWADQMKEWSDDPANKANSKAGDDRTPPWRWLGCLNFDDAANGIVTMPSEYIMSCIMGGAAQVPTGKGKTTFKSLSQSGLLCSDFHWPLLVQGKELSMKTIRACRELKTFKEQCARAEELGFSLFVKRAKIGQAKHIRVRPRLDNWSTSGDILIVDEQITVKILQTILDISGRLKGLGDWRPGAPKPGPWGMFTAKVTAV